MKEMKFIPDGPRRLQESQGYEKELVAMNKQIDEMKAQMKQSTPLQKREIEGRLKQLIEQRKALCPKSALW